MDTRPIGVFDSGLGGLTAVRELRKSLPHEDIIYLGDTARVPYGTRSKEIVTKFSLQDAYFLAGRGVKAIVIACNTASSLSFGQIKKKIAIPLFEVVGAGARDAVLKSKKGRIGVIGTLGTINSGAYKKAILKLSAKAKVYSRACPLFVPCIESGEVKGDLINLLIEKYLKELKKAKIDTLILGCTHYPILEQAIKSYLGKNVQIIDPAIGLSASVLEFLKKKDFLANKNNGWVKYFLTDVTDQTKNIAELFLGKRLNGVITKVNLE